MDYMEQGDLRSVLDKSPSLPLMKKLQIACDVCEGMQFLHNSNIIHRDLKSRNVLLDRYGRAKISGFGVRERKVRESPLKYVFNTANSSVDVYDVGVLLWELETGKVPWEDRTSKQIKLTLTAKEAKVCHPGLMKLMNICMECDREKPQRFGEIWAILQSMLEEESKRIEDKKKAIPDGFICPITQDVMKDPVILIADGHSYERKAILDWLQRGGRSPLTNEVIENKNNTATGWEAHVIDNYSLKSAIESFLMNRQQC
jgi:serine/threonine protein kinase